MREEIIERIELIKQGKLPKGYKKTIIGMIPVDWKIVRFDECASISRGLVDPKKTPYNRMKHVGPENIEKETGIISDVQTAKEQGLISGKFVFDNDSIIYSKIRPKLNKVCMPDFCGICSADCYVIHMKDKVQRRYLYYYILSDNFLKQAISCSMRTKMPKVNQEELSSFKVILPQLMEQEKIVNILKLYDDKIRCLKTMIYDKIRFKKWLMQSLLTGKKRLSGFGDKWKKVKIGSFIYEIDERSTHNNEYEILSVTKTGIRLQSEHFKKQIASDNNVGYKIIRRGNLVFSTMNLWMGSLDVLSELDTGIVSPAYKVFEFNVKQMCAQFGKYFMKTEHMIWVYNINSEQGASIVRKNLDLEGLLSYVVKIPKVQEQKAIAKVLETADKEIDLLEQKLDLIKQEKKAIMQLLLTGIVRVP